jgi:hypothetical protein
MILNPSDTVMLDNNLQFFNNELDIKSTKMGRVEIGIPSNE